MEAEQNLFLNGGWDVHHHIFDRMCWVIHMLHIILIAHL